MERPRQRRRTDGGAPDGLAVRGALGVSSHYLVGADLPAEDWNRRVDGFDVEALADQLAAAGCGYYLLTLGQNSGHFCTPNATYDRLTGIRPSKCSRRDLVADLIAALRARGIAFLAYLPSGAPAGDRAAARALAWEWGYPGDWPSWGGPTVCGRLAAFQQHWEAIVREWALRYGADLRGWWFDGCYFADAMYRHPDAPNFASFAAAARAGNPEAILAFNPGVKLETVTDEEDCLAGETNEPETVACPGRMVDGRQWRLWSYLGQSWMQPPVRFDDAAAAETTRRLVAPGGVVTWDVPLEPDGRIAEPFHRQLCRIGEAVAALER